MPPNMALQRTRALAFARVRSLPSVARRSPLNARSLGGSHPKVSRPRLRWLAVLCALLATHSLLASSPVFMKRPSDSELTVLRLLSQDQLTADALTPLLKVALSEPEAAFRMAVILAAAIREGALPMSVVERSMIDGGCRQDSEDVGICRSFRESVVAAVAYQSPPKDLPRIQAQLLKSGGERTGGNPGLETAYTSALIDSKQLTVSDVVRAYLSGDLHSGGVVDEEVAATFGRLTINGEVVLDRRLATEHWRNALAGALAQRLHESRGSPEIVRQVRNVPEELLSRARGVNTMDWTRLRRDSLCVIDDWRTGDAAPDRWTAWAQLLKCRGW